MKKTLVLAGVLLGLLLSVSLGVACKDSGGSLSLEEYFAKLEELDQKFEADSATADAESAEAGEDVDAIKDSFGEFVALIEDFVNELDDVDPPSEVEDAHNAGVEAGRDIQEEFERVIDKAQDAETLEELGAIFEDEELNAASDRFTQACLDLEQIAADNNIDADLNCDDEGSDGEPADTAPDAEPTAEE
jgi:hypothetical protein